MVDALTGHRDRVGALDGLRGWAALSVLGFHFYAETFAHVLPQPAIVALFAVFNGPLAVGIFFVLSGYVLTIGSWRSPDKTPALRLIVKRHARLAIPILAVTIIVALLRAAHLTFNTEAALIVRRQDWLGGFLDFSPDAGSAVTYAFVSAFFPDPPKNYVPFLWTMTTELWFSYIILLLCVLERGALRPYLILSGIVATLLVLNPVVACFPAGALLSLAQRDGHLKAELPLRAAIGTILFALIAGGLLHATTYDERGNILISAILVATVLLSPELTRFLSRRTSQILGRLSFPMYLAQFPILVSLTSGMIVRCGQLDATRAVIIGLVSIAATLALATLILPAESLARWFGQQIERVARRFISRANEGSLRTTLP